MIHSFYNVRAREKVESEVVAKVEYRGKKGTRYAFKGVSADGGKLTAFVAKDKYLSLTDIQGTIQESK